MSGQKAVLADDGRRQREFGDLARDQIEVGRLGGALGHDLDEAGVVDAVVVVMAGMYVQRSLGDGAAAHVEHVRQTLANSGVERLVHERHALPRREIYRAQPGHRHTSRDPGSRVFGFWLDKNQRPVGDIEMAGGDLLGPVFAHLRGWRNRIGAGRVRSFALDMNDGGIAVDRFAHARVFDRLRRLAGATGLQQRIREQFFD